jgi:hypothetical protein
VIEELVDIIYNKIDDGISWSIITPEDICNSISITGKESFKNSRIHIRNKNPENKENITYSVIKQKNNISLFNYDKKFDSVISLFNEIVSLMEDDDNYSNKIDSYKSQLRKEKIKSL